MYCFLSHLQLNPYVGSFSSWKGNFSQAAIAISAVFVVSSALTNFHRKHVRSFTNHMRAARGDEVRRAIVAAQRLLREANKRNRREDEKKCKRRNREKKEEKK